MHLPVNPPVLPMLAKRVGELPAGDDWIFEPKWDGFRTLVFRDGDEILIQSRDEKPLNRYFPELLEPLLSAAARALRARWRDRHRHGRRARFRRAAAAPSSGRVAREASVAADPGIGRVLRSALRRRPRSARRAVSKAGARELESLLSARSAADPSHAGDLRIERRLRLVPPLRRRRVSTGSWPSPLPDVYEPNKRVMLKVKHERDCDCVVAGFRWHKKGERTAVGSLLLGLFDDAGALQHVGVCASFTAEKRSELVEFLAPYRENALADHPWKRWAEHGTAAGDGEHRMPGGQSRWSQGKDLSWEPLRPELVVEVAYEHMQGTRFRHMAQFRRWRTDKKPARLHLRPARSGPAAGAEGDLRHRPLIAAPNPQPVDVLLCASSAKQFSRFFLF